jgi:hypothetical protein
VAPDDTPGSRGTGGGKTLIEDTWEITHSPERVVVHLIAAREARPVGPGLLGIAA